MEAELVRSSNPFSSKEVIDLVKSSEIDKKVLKIFTFIKND